MSDMRKGRGWRLGAIIGIKKGVFGKPCFRALPNKRILTKTAKMPKLLSTHENKGFAPRTPPNDKKDEKGGRRPGKSIVYQKQVFLP